MKKLTILVTGASGFLGSNILKKFIKVQDIQVIAACRDGNKLADFFQGEIREGDLTDADYRRSVVEGIDIICHAGTWAAMWNHEKAEEDNFFKPALGLINAAMDAGVKRFIMTSTVAVTRPGYSQTAIVDDFSATHHTGFWPHVDRIVDIDRYMQENAGHGMQMTSLRLGHFIGKGNSLGIVPALVPRLKTHLVPWINRGRSRLPLLSDTDAANSFIAVALAETLEPYESFNIVGAELPSTREVIEFIAEQTGSPTPLFSVPYPVAYAFAWLMEKLFPILPGKAPFLTRSIIHLAEDWNCSNHYAHSKLGYTPQKHWKVAMQEALDELKEKNYPWQQLAQR